MRSYTADSSLGDGARLCLKIASAPIIKLDNPAVLKNHISKARMYSDYLGAQFKPKCWTINCAFLLKKIFLLIGCSRLAISHQHAHTFLLPLNIVPNSQSQHLSSGLDWAASRTGGNTVQARYHQSGWHNSRRSDLSLQRKGRNV